MYKNRNDSQRLWWWDDDQGYKWLGTEQEKYTSQKVNYKITLGHWKFMPAECVK